jgi:hypothetical protein
MTCSSMNFVTLARSSCARGEGVSPADCVVGAAQLLQDIAPVTDKEGFNNEDGLQVRMRMG